MLNLFLLIILAQISSYTEEINQLKAGLKESYMQVNEI